MEHRIFKYLLRYSIIIAGLVVGLFILSACAPSTVSQAPPTPTVQQVPPSPAPSPSAAPIEETVIPPAVIPPISESQTSSSIKVGLLVPLSGPEADVGQSLLEAAQMAVYDHGSSGFELLPQDTGSTSEGAAKAAQQAVDKKANLIIGPLLASAVDPVRQVAQPVHIPVLSFSNNPKAAGNGVFLLGLTPEDQVRRIISYAQSRGYQRIAALTPSTPYGDAVVQGLSGNTSIQVRRYDPASKDLSSFVKGIVADPNNFDAILIADGGNILRHLASLIDYYKADDRKIQLLGTGLWDDASLISESALNGGWFVGPNPQARADFEQRYQALYNHKPHRLATLAYDATALAAVLEHSSHQITEETLTNPSGFLGLDGVFRFHYNGRAERQLAVLEITPQGVRVQDPAPTKFSE